MDRLEIEKLVKKNGIKNQSMIAMEGCAKLIQAISKCVRSKELIPIEVREHLIEEMADVMICIEQLQFMYHVGDEELYAWMIAKHQRNMMRLEDEIKKEKRTIGREGL